jgi:hypothetical protein
VQVADSFVPSEVEGRTLGLSASAPRLRSGRTDGLAQKSGTALAGRRRVSDRFFEARLLARNGWGQPTRKALRFAFYLRSHWMRMPPLMLARHLWTKATR